MSLGMNTLKLTMGLAFLRDRRAGLHLKLGTRNFRRAHNMIGRKGVDVCRPSAHSFRSTPCSCDCQGPRGTRES